MLNENESTSGRVRMKWAAWVSRKPTQQRLTLQCSLTGPLVKASPNQRGWRTHALCPSDWVSEYPSLGVPLPDGWLKGWRGPTGSQLTWGNFAGGISEVAQAVPLVCEETEVCPGHSLCGSGPQVVDHGDRDAAWEKSGRRWGEAWGCSGPEHPTVSCHTFGQLWF